MYEKGQQLESLQDFTFWIDTDPDSRGTRFLKGSVFTVLESTPWGSYYLGFEDKILKDVHVGEDWFKALEFKRQLRSKRFLGVSY